MNPEQGDNHYSAHDRAKPSEKHISTTAVATPTGDEAGEPPCQETHYKPEHECYDQPGSQQADEREQYLPLLRPLATILPVRSSISLNRLSQPRPEASNIKRMRDGA